MPLENQPVHECAEQVTAAEIAWPSCSMNRTHTGENFGTSIGLVLFADRSPLRGFSNRDRKAVFDLEIEQR